MNIKHICIQGFVRETPCIFRGIELIRGQAANKVECPLCKKLLVVDHSGNVLV